MFKKLFSFRSFFVFICFAMLVYLVVKTEHMNSKLSLVVKPAKRFSLTQIISEYPFNPEWEVNTPPETVQFVNMLTQQPFYWLGKGFQATAFVSEDGDYVLKFFHQGRLKEVPFLHNPIGFLFSKEFRDKMNERQSHREEIFSSSKMAYEEFPEESGIMYIHLNRTDDQIKGIKLHDFSGLSYRVRGDDTSFVLQKRAVYVLPTIKSLMAEGKVEEAKARINQIFDLLLTMAKKGFLDGDLALMRNNNIGFVENRAVYIDTGHITRRQNVNLKERMLFEFDVRVAPLHDWLKVRYPELAAHYKEHQAQVMSTLTDTPVAANNKLNAKPGAATK